MDISSSTAAIYERVATCEQVHRSTFDQEKWENPARAARYLASGECEAHADPEQH